MLCESKIALEGEEYYMKVRSHTPEQLVRKLREVDRMLGEGSTVVEVCKHLEVVRRPTTRDVISMGG